MKNEHGNYDNTYWNGRGKYKAENEAANKHIPSEGRAATMELNLLRAMANYYYDLYNNGLCNRELRQPYVRFFLEDFTAEILATDAASVGDIRTVIEATEDDAEAPPQSLIDAFERVTDACVLIAFRSLKSRTTIGRLKRRGRR